MNSIKNLYLCNRYSRSGRHNNSLIKNIMKHLDTMNEWIAKAKQSIYFGSALRAADRDNIEVTRKQLENALNVSQGTLNRV